jgi:hypothetical protein
MINLGRLSQMSPLGCIRVGNHPMYITNTATIHTHYFSWFVKIISTHSHFFMFETNWWKFWKLFNCEMSRFYIFQHIKLIILNNNFHCKWYRNNFLNWNLPNFWGVFKHWNGVTNFDSVLQPVRLTKCCFFPMETKGWCCSRCVSHTDLDSV